MSFSLSLAPEWVKGRSLFLGLRHDNRPAGITTPRHLITIAGARSGKGAGLIIPNLLSWSDGSVLVIDPKGENAEATWKEREGMGHKVHVVDPFKIANVPDRVRSALNPLDAVDPDSLTAREDIRVIADGLVMRYNAKDAMWDNGAVSVISGVIAHALTTAPPHMRNLLGVRSLLQRPEDELEEVWQAMAQNRAIGGLARTAATVGLNSAKSAREFVKGAGDNTEWLDSEAMQSVLGHSDFKMADLKNGKTAVYLVLPADYLEDHGRFLRLFVRCALSAMAKGGRSAGKCLFILDEFYSLGHINEISKAAGLMPAYGVHLWPFLQDLGQLITLYGKEGAETFFGNSDAHIFFGLTDQLTLDHVSIRLGRFGHDDITTAKPYPVLQAPPTYRGTSSDPLTSWELNQIAHETDMWKWEAQREDSLRFHQESTAYEADARKIGQPRFPPERVREIIAKHEGDILARSMIVFNTGGRVFNLTPFGHWMDLPSPLDPVTGETEEQATARRKAEYVAKREAEADATDVGYQQKAADHLADSQGLLLFAAAGFIVAAGLIAYSTGWLWFGGCVISLLMGWLVGVAIESFKECRKYRNLRADRSWRAYDAKNLYS